MTGRSRIGRFYVRRDRYGQFKKWTGIGRSLASDRRKNAITRVRSGYGHLGDIKSPIDRIVNI